MNRLTYIFIFITHLTYGQCGLTQSTKADGSKLYSTFPKMIGHNNKDLQAGLSLQSTDNADFIGLIVRFKGDAIELKGDLILVLSNDKTITCQFIKQTKEYSGGSNCSIGVFLIKTQSDFDELGKSNINKTKFSLTNNTTQIISVTMNVDCVKSIIQCLKNNGKVDTVSNTKTTSKKVDSKKASVISELEKKNGFKDFNFGKSVDEISSIHKLKYIQNVTGESVYEVMDSSLSTINDVTINRIECYFVDNKLIRVSIHLMYNSKISDLLIETFGQPTESVKNPESKVETIKIYECYYWLSKNIHLSYVHLAWKNSDEYKLNYQKADYDKILIDAKKIFLQNKKGDL